MILNKKIVEGAEVLALDQSLTETGYWISEEFNGTLKTKPGNVTKRLAFLRKKITEFFIDHNIGTVVMEGYSYNSKNTKFTFTAGELGGMIKMVCHDYTMKLIIIPPTLLKKFVCGKGNVKKEQMLLQIYKKFSKEFNNNNLADAFALHAFFKEYNVWLRFDKTFPKYEIECFKALQEILQNEQLKT